LLSEPTLPAGYGRSVSADPATSIVTRAPLAPYTTLGLGGPADDLVIAHDEQALIAAVDSADAAGVPVLILGGGSNVVLADEGFAGRAILVRTAGVQLERADGTVRVTVAAGEEWDDLVCRTLDAGLAGLECLSGIPGRSGGAPIQNVGAYGQEVAETCLEVRVWDRKDRAVRALPADACGFAYRTSVFKQHPGRYVVLSVKFGLGPSDLSAPIRYAQLAEALDVSLGERVPLQLVRDTVLSLRRSKGMVLDPDDPDSRSVGSFFLNPVLEAADYAELTTRLGRTPPHWPAGSPDSGQVKVSAAWLVEAGGFGRGYGEGPVGISGKHALALIHRGGGRTADLLALADEIVKGVQRATGVTLHPEARIIPHQVELGRPSTEKYPANDA
jgi:UDP-N-acetylmuramate dehydrogenase